MGVIGPIPIPDLGPVQPFGLLVATGVLLGTRIIFRRASKLGLGEDWPRRGALVVLIGAFLVSHWVERIYYIPEQLFEDGPLELLAFWAGMSSFGGFIGALWGLLLFTGWSQASKVERNLAIALPPLATLLAYVSLPVAQLVLPVAIAVSVVLMRRSDGRRILFADSIMEGLVLGWAFGRAGCTLVFDHPGSPSDWGLAMVYTDGIARHNLGLYELMLTALVLGPAGIILRKIDVRPGVLVASISILYAPVRFVLDYFRLQDVSGADPRYFGLTAGQYSSVALLLGGIGILVVSLTRPPKPIPDPVEPLPKGGAGKAKSEAKAKGEGKAKGKGKSKNKKNKKK